MSIGFLVFVYLTLVFSPKSVKSLIGFSRSSLYLLQYSSGSTAFGNAPAVLIDFATAFFILL